ncbi:DNA methylase [Treponema ruminis]|uniref:DNA polymerase V n=1 Tax=Treponema ruminis TaxID=744515 RepID=A0A7W8GAB0_9SPIR|nr:DNA methylase [Treponema ruminis]MBB5226777.1 DNA polymerase V [Treponema ruminis]QSI02000.1 DNA methylase [Treponema ruminis]
MEKTYLAIDLKSFYASVECVERGLDPLTTKLVVADESRTEKTICLAVTPALKAYGLSGRSRLFEVVQKAKEVKARTGKELDYIIAKPRMALYLEYSARIYGIYLKYFSPDDIHVYSIDEVFIDATSYLTLYSIDAQSLVRKVIKDILSQTGITATAGIAPNLFLCKIAMDIVAKHVEADEDGVRIASLSVKEYRQQLWNHTPITDFWRIGNGTANRLSKLGLYTMGDIVRQSLRNEDVLYKMFGIDAEILIDHAWGLEPCTIKHIKDYKTSNKSISEGQVLQEPYTNEKARIVVREMAEVLAQNLKSEQLASDLFGLYISYDRISITDDYHGAVEMDFYGRPAPKATHGSIRITPATASLQKISEGMLSVFDRVTDKNLFIRRINISADNVISQKEEQIDLFTDVNAQKREMSLQDTMLKIQSKFGKNAILKASDYEEGATLRQRNEQIGGHRA